MDRFSCFECFENLHGLHCLDLESWFARTARRLSHAARCLALHREDVGDKPVRLGSILLQQPSGSHQLAASNHSDVLMYKPS